MRGHGPPTYRRLLNGVQLETSLGTSLHRRTSNSSAEVTIVYKQPIMNLRTIIFCLLTLSLFGCAGVGNQEKKTTATTSEAFDNYWYSGVAELTRYELEQARYGEIRQGDAVLIFVTEDFLTDQQVKYEYGERDDKVQSVLKLNFTRKFLTGIYPYSMMSSIFTPVDVSQPTLKVTTTSQEWCGHTFSQLNYRNGKFEGHLFSYFQAEGDRTFTLPGVLLEDEIWTKLRLDPAALPTGEIELVPGTQFLRLRHREFAAEKAQAELTAVQDTALSDQPLKRYRVSYEDFERVLEITFEAAFPYTIVAWEEKTPSGFGDDATTLTTRAVRTHSMKSAYWSQNEVADGILRKELGLNENNY